MVKEKQVESNANEGGEKMSENITESKANRDYQITFGQMSISTTQRKLARAIVELAKENDIEVSVTRIAKPKPVKFAGL